MEMGDTEPSASLDRRGLVDRSYDRFSSGVEAFISRVDGLFAGKASYDAPTGSYVRVGGEVAMHRSRHGGTDPRAFISAKIRLPRTSDRLQLVVDQGIESITVSETQREAERAQGLDTDDQDVFVGLRGVVTESLKVSLTSDVGLRFRGLSPDPYVRGRALRTFSLGQWEVPLSETFLWRRRGGFTAVSELAFLREVAPDTVLSALSNATFVDSSNNWLMSQIFGIYRRLEGNTLLAYEVGILGHTDPRLEVTAYTLAIRYRQKFMRDWIIGEIRPQLTFPHERDFAGVPSLTLRIEAYFGKGTLPEP